MKKVVCFLLSLILFLLCSCNNSSGQKKRKDNYGIPQITEALSDYVIIRSEKASPEEIEASVNLKKAIFDATGLELPISDDFVKSGTKFAEKEKEILIGKTNRTESEDADSDLKLNDYRITFINKKIILASPSSKAVLSAVDGFKNDYLTAKLKLFSDESIFHYQYPISSALVSQNNLADYKIVTRKNASDKEKKASEIIQKYISENAGFILSISDDESEEIPFEILLGKTNRAKSNDFYSGRETSFGNTDCNISVSDGKIILTAGVDSMLPGVSESFCDLLTAQGKNITLNDNNIYLKDGELKMKFDKYMKYRKPLSNTANLLAGKKALKVGYIGGSVTAGSAASDPSVTSWRAKTTAWFRESFPETEITEINAAVGDSFSKYAIYRVETDLLQYNPDIVFVEFAINDSPWYSGIPTEESMTYFETLIRKIYEYNPETEIVFVYTIDSECDMSADYFPQAAEDEKIAEAYGIPTVNFGKALADYIKENDFAWSDYFNDRVHPIDIGFEYYTDVITEFLTKALDRKYIDTTEIISKVLPKPQTAVVTKKLTMLEAGEIDLSSSSGWELSEDRKYIFTKTTKNELVINFTGTELCTAAARGLTFKYSVDNGAEQAQSMNRKPQIFCSKLERGKHQIKIRALDVSEGKISTISRIMYS